MNNLDFVRPIINDNINYRKDQKELIQRAMEISNGNPLNVLQYFVTCMNHEGYDIEFELVFTIPANEEVTITLPIIETDSTSFYKKDELGYYVSWNDEITHNTNVHTYKSIDEIKDYHVRFFGLGISGFGMQSLDNDGYKKYLTKVISFGILGHTFTSLEYAFYNCQNNFTIPQTLPSSITDTNRMFSCCYNFNQPLNTWITSNVTNMCNMFGYCTNFNQSLKWNTSNVTNMCGMFMGCINFNQPLEWNTSNVTNMSNMFMFCTNFNQPLNAWNTSNVTDMCSMFEDCTNFNQPLTSWNTSNVTNMNNMFSCCIHFSQSLEWNTSNVTNMDWMFYGCNNFNQPLTSWDTSNVTNMNGMFHRCTNFNQPLTDWNTSNVTNMRNMFYKCINFNQPLTNWNISNVTKMNDIFFDCNISEENKPRFP